MNSEVAFPYFDVSHLKQTQERYILQSYIDALELKSKCSRPSVDVDFGEEIDAIERMLECDDEALGAMYESYRNSVRGTEFEPILAAAIDLGSIAQQRLSSFLEQFNSLQVEISPFQAEDSLTCAAKHDASELMYARSLAARMLRKCINLTISERNLKHRAALIIAELLSATPSTMSAALGYLRFSHEIVANLLSQIAEHLCVTERVAFFSEALSTGVGLAIGERIYQQLKFRTHALQNQRSENDNLQLIKVLHQHRAQLIDTLDEEKVASLMSVSEQVLPPVTGWSSDALVSSPAAAEVLHLVDFVIPSIGGYQLLPVDWDDVYAYTEASHCEALMNQSIIIALLRKLQRQFPSVFPINTP
ncbi:hypothetical protein K0504_09915 [Neiella marina]|uniref:HDOD domain-containing protein n=1 Tax=Neiella holothuriorum TaxID=2870530 RepID=A0ABS7EGC4_9GAMM|nr:hypothetical protein [Neiella holothuriorum]MBW8191353.1 hypothetical protein [Neiella holothuriorum]